MLLVGVLAAMACSSASSSAPPASCLSDPKSCGPGKTCWAVDAVPNFACVASGPAAFAAPCDDTIGQATCGDGLTCDQTGPSKGACTHFCDESTPCPSGYTCWETHAGSSNGPSLLLCRPGVASGMPEGGADEAGGGDGGLGGFDAKSDSPVTSR
jgi:hypothetical protein